MLTKDLRQKFSSHRSDAKRRGIPFLLTFEEWLDIWSESGKLEQRGNRSGRYVMARYGDKGAYEPDNVRIILFEENAREKRMTLDAKIKIGKAHRGKIVSVATRERLSLSAQGRIFSFDTRLKMSATQKLVFRQRGENGQFTGGVK